MITDIVILGALLVIWIAFWRAMASGMIVAPILNAGRKWWGSARSTGERVTMSSRAQRNPKLWIAVTFAAAVVGVASWYFLIPQPSALPLSFDGSSDALQHTVVIPTLDSPIPEEKSVIWCASFQLAWNRLKTDVAKEPVKIANAQPIADRLNRSPQSEQDLESDAVYAAAGFAKDGIVERIQKEMSEKFPRVPRPQFDATKDAAVAYGYLEVSSKFEYPYIENDEPFAFTDSSGRKTAVSSFGIRRKDAHVYKQLRGQVEVLYHSRAATTNDEFPEFILDLDKTSHPYQIVLARIHRQPTLAETIADVKQKIAANTGRRSLGDRDTVLVPNMAWKIAHRFKELEGSDHRFFNPALTGRFIATALQTIRFRLDSKGAELESDSTLRTAKSQSSDYHVNRPFLLYLKKRGGQHPFFVMWVENAELLQNLR